MGLENWTHRTFQPAEYDKAGKVLISSSAQADEYDDAIEKINNWRSSHSYPLHTFYVWLRKKTRDLDGRSLVARRIKRLSSIEAKLIRFSHIKLSKMQDIGGCRAIVGSVPKVKKLVNSYKESDLRHVLIKENDYISNPKESGYRGVHLVYQYLSDKHEYWNGLKVEVQLRSRIQHAWATSVEVFGTFTSQALKSSQGDPNWLKFFSLMGSALAMKENSPLVPNTPSNKSDLVKQIRSLEKKLKVKKNLETYGQALKTLQSPSASGANYFLLILNPVTEEIRVEGFKARKLIQANDRYLEVERNIKAQQTGEEAVLVAVESLASLRRAYPNYFLDTKLFINELNAILK